MGETGFYLRTFSMPGEPPAGHICYLSEYSYYTSNTSVSKVFFLWYNKKYSCSPADDNNFQIIWSHHTPHLLLLFPIL
jgi:hypothetical protein